jgi:site-specific DNA recombinase
LEAVSEPPQRNNEVSRGTGILNNELYIGRMLWNRQRFVLHPITRRRIPRLNADGERLVVDVPHLRIVSDELWHAAKQRQGEVRKRMMASPSIQVARRPRYLFSGLTRCGVCGHGYTMYSAHHLTCAGARDRGVCDNRLTIRRGRLEERVLNAMYLRFWDAEAITLYCQGIVNLRRAWAK